MKVQFIEPMGGKDFVYSTNEVYDLPNDQAKRFIKAGICVADSDLAKEEIKVKKTIIGKTAKVTKKKK